ncbi:hypothetical protein [Aureimonas sp. SK2]|uniref:hypothetical protein n=1 Tax=Aureimonas sp. SK2 TaxID=3015992 RepID=UPI0024440F97|nr:hypothetical protein [Aureimonas sp. SK2]
MSDDRHPSRPGADDPIAYADWCTRKETREYVGARLMLIARGVVPGPDPIQQLAELEIIDIVTGRGSIKDGNCPT